MDTWQAYNAWGGKSLYDLPASVPRANDVSFDRPYDVARAGGPGAARLGAPARPVHRAERLRRHLSVRRLDRRAPQDACCTTAWIVVAGHSEYWTKTMRDGWDAARDAGVNLAFMGANDAYWQVRSETAGGRSWRTSRSYDPNPDPALKTAMFRELTPPRYECELIGIQHQGVGLHWRPATTPSRRPLSAIRG